MTSLQNIKVGHGIPFSDALKVWLKVALLSFGGPAGQIAVMHRLLVEEKRWVSEQRFLHALNYCMLLPGPEAQQLAIYLGWILHRTLGGITAGVLFVLPGFFSILLLSIIYVLYQEMPLVDALFFSLKPAVLAIVLQAVTKIGKKALINSMMVLVAAISFMAIFVFNIPFPIIIMSAALIGLLGGRFTPALFPLKPDRAKGTSTAILDQAMENDQIQAVATGWRRNVKIIGICFALWFAPMIVLALTVGLASVFMKESLFFSKMAVVTFGGAYAVLAYVAQQAVEQYGWLEPSEMIDGLGMAETTPGPLIQVLQFVGFMGAYRYADGLDPLLSGILASFLVTWVTFVPCFLWIFLGAPYIEKLRGNAHLSHALSAITAAVVGVILNLSVWFSLHALFQEVRLFKGYEMSLSVPILSSVNHATFVLTLIAVIAIFRFKLGMIKTLGLCVFLGSAYRLLF